MQSNVATTTGRSATPLFADVMDGCIYGSVNPKACIPLTETRKISTSGVERFQASMAGRSEESDNCPVMGLVCGSDVAIVVPLTGTLKCYVRKHFESLDLDEGDLNTKIDAFDTWYGIVDGHHRHKAILRIIDAGNAGWDGFMLPVIILNGGSDLHRLKQLARSQNSRNSENYYVETTLYDLLCGLKDEYDRMSMSASPKKKKTNCGRSGLGFRWSVSWQREHC